MRATTKIEIIFVIFSDKQKRKLAPFFRHLGGELKSPSFVHGWRAAFLYHSVPPDVNPFLARFCSAGVAARAE